MEEELYADRATVREVLRTHPDWSTSMLADHLGRSVSWVKKWRTRLRLAPADDDTVLAGLSRARKQPPPSVAPVVVDRILELRDQPPDHLQRVPGPRTIRSFLQQDADAWAAGARLPRSPTTSWRLLRRHGRIPQRQPRAHEPLERPAPLTSWQLDVKDVSTVPADPTGKRLHVVETLNCVDCGTSILLDAQVRDDFTEETALIAVADLLRTHGLPQVLTIDRDPRFVGSPHGRDFPSPLIRFLTCVGVEVTVCPPQRPDRNGFVERDHRTYDSEWLRVHRPTTLEHAREITAAFVDHYNNERPNQAITCGNRPPRLAFPALPARPPVPATVAPDRWLQAIDGRHYVRKVRAGGSVSVEQDSYDVSQKLAGQYVVLSVAAQERALLVHHQGKVIKRVAIKGLWQGLVPFDEYVVRMQQEARARDRRAGRSAARAA